MVGQASGVPGRWQVLPSPPCTFQVAELQGWQGSNRFAEHGIQTGGVKTNE